MLDGLDLEKVLFLDIETVSQYKDYEELVPEGKKLWDHKARIISRGEEQDPSDIYGKAAIYAEFGKIVCISVGFLRRIPGAFDLRIKSFADHEEKILLEGFCDLLNKHFSYQDHLLCAHNGKEFDFPYIARRLLINGLPLPNLLNIAGKKPWEIKHLDTLELWKFGDYKNYTGLPLLAHVFGIPTPKDDIDGSQVGAVYWQEDDLDRIVEYCQKDVITIVQLVLRLKGLPIVENNLISIS